MPSTTIFLAASAAVGCALARNVPENAQVIDQKSFNVLETVPPPSVYNGTTVCPPSPAAFAKLEMI
jgi:gluconolactonase